MRNLGIKMAQVLTTGKNVPIGDFVMNKVPKMDFEKFHGSTRKDFHGSKSFTI